MEDLQLQSTMQQQQQQLLLQLPQQTGCDVSTDTKNNGESDTETGHSDYDHDDTGGSDEDDVLVVVVEEEEEDEDEEEDEEEESLRQMEAADSLLLLSQTAFQRDPKVQHTSDAEKEAIEGLLALSLTAQSSHAPDILNQCRSNDPGPAEVQKGADALLFFASSCKAMSAERSSSPSTEELEASAVEGLLMLSSTGRKRSSSGNQLNSSLVWEWLPDFEEDGLDYYSSVPSPPKKTKREKRWNGDFKKEANNHSFKSNSVLRRPVTLGQMQQEDDQAIDVTEVIDPYLPVHHDSCHHSCGSPVVQWMHNYSTASRKKGHHHGMTSSHTKNMHKKVKYRSQ